MSNLKSLSLLCKEYPADDSYIQEKFQKIATNPILNTLLTEFKPSTILDYISAEKNSGINPILAPFSTEELKEAEEITNYWLFPIIWTQAIQEEVAYKENDYTNPLMESILKTYKTRLEGIIHIRTLPELFNTIERVSPYNLNDIVWKGEFDLMKYVFENNNIVLNDNNNLMIYYNNNIQACIDELPMYCRTLECLEYAYKSGCKFNTYTTLYAVRYNITVDCLKYMYENGAPLYYQIMEEAALHGNLESMIYLHEVCQVQWNTTVSNNAAVRGHLECLKYAHENGCPWGEKICSSAAQYGHLDCLKYAHENGCPWDEWTTIEASKYRDSVECLKYAIENGCPMDRIVSIHIAEHGDIELLKCVHKMGCPLDESLCHYSAKNGNLECLKYARENGCPWDENSICSATAEKNAFKCLKYAYENGCKLNTNTFREAAGNGNVKMLKFLYKNKCPFDKRATEYAAYRGKLENLKYLKKIGCPWDEEACKNAADEGYFDCLKYLHENGCPWNAESIIRNERYIRYESCKECIEYVRNNS